MRTLYKISFLLAALSVSAANAAPSVQEPVQETDAAPANMALKSGTVANYLAGQFARTTGDIEGAIRYLRRAQQANPNNLEIIGQLQGLLLVNGNIEEAVQLAANLPPNTPKNSLISLLLCLDAVKRGDNDRAAAILDEAYETSNGQLWLPLVSGWVDLGRRQLQQPLKIAIASAEGSQTSALTQYHLALINAQAGFKDAAAENFRRAIVDVANPPSRVMQMITRFFGKNIPAPLAQAYASWRKENSMEAAVPEDIGPMFTIKDGIAEILFTMGNVVQGAGAPQEAVIYLHMAHYLKPEFTLVSVSLADAYSDLKQYDKANPLYASIPEKSDLYMRAQLRIAMNQNQSGDMDAALGQLDKLSRALPKRFEAAVAKGDLLRNHQRFEEAAEAYSVALARIASPEVGHWPVFFARGVCLERQNKWAEAEADFKQALKLKPDQPDVLNYLGYGWLIREEHLDEAREMLEKAVSLRPNDPQIADSMGWALFKLGQYNEAVTYLEKALELLPSDPTINDHLGDAYWMLGRKNEARFQWERSLTYAPQREEAAAIQKKLEDGLGAMSDSGNAPVVAERRLEVSVP